MKAATAGWDMTCRVLDKCSHGGMIDREIGGMEMPSSDDSNFTGTKLFTYMLYELDVSQYGLDMLGLNDIDATRVQK